MPDPLSPAGTPRTCGPSDPEPFDAVVLAGGAARRLGGADKPGLDVGGRTLLERVADAVAQEAGASAHLVVVGPRRASPRARYVSEDPPGAGPVPALRAGMGRVTAPWVALLAADLPFLQAGHLRDLRRAAAEHGAAVLEDGDGRAQWLTGLWNTGRVRAALDGYTGTSLRGVLAPLEPWRVPLRDAPPSFDCDTPEDLARARRALGGH